METFKNITKCPICGERLIYPAAYCIFCNNILTYFLLVYYSKTKIIIVCFNKKGEIIGIDYLKNFLHLYNSPNEEGYHITVRNLAYQIFERIHSRRPRKVYLNISNKELLRELEYFLFYEYVKLSCSSLKECIDKVLRIEMKGKRLEKINVLPKEKIGGKHTTIIGEKKGLEIILKIASIPYVKKIIPGRIHAKGSKGGGGIRVKISRIDDKGNIKVILSEGQTNQDIYIITTASTFEEGKIIAEYIRKVLANS